MSACDADLSCYQADGVKARQSSKPHVRCRRVSGGCSICGELETAQASSECKGHRQGHRPLLGCSARCAPPRQPCRGLGGSGGVALKGAGEWGRPWPAQNFISRISGRNSAVRARIRTMFHVSGSGFGCDGHLGGSAPIRLIGVGPPESASQPDPGPKMQTIVHIRALGAHGRGGRPPDPPAGPQRTTTRAYVYPRATPEPRASLTMECGSGAPARGRAFTASVQRRTGVFLGRTISSCQMGGPHLTVRF